MAYSSVSIIALVVLLITNIDLLFKKKTADHFPAHRVYRFFIISVAFFYLADLLWGFFETYDVHFFDYGITVSFFAIMSISVFFWALYVVEYLGHKFVFSKLLRVVGALLMVTGLVIIIINFFKPIMFEFVDGEYKSLPFRTIYFIAQAVMFLFTSIYAFVFAYINKDKRIKIKHVAIGIFGLEMALMIGIQIPYPAAPIYSFGYFLGLLIINTFVVTEQKKEYRIALAEGKAREQKAQEELGSAMQLAYTDSLTGVKSKHAYVEAEERIDKEIADGTALPFAVIVFDLNDLKFINDKLGHDYGDDYIKNSCALVEKFFSVDNFYRFGGDEFVMICQGEDYKDRHEKLSAFNKVVEKNFETGAPIIATGISDYRQGKDNTYRAVFERADARMYIRKKQLKELGRVDILAIQKGSREHGQNYEEYIKAEMLRIREESTKISNPRLAFYKNFYQNEEYSLIDLLNNSSCDEVMEVNLKEDTTKQLFHVDGKYFVPIVEGSFKELSQFVSEYIVHPDDRQIYESLMNPNGILERLRNNEIPNFGCEQFRYRLQDGDYRYVEQCVITGQENGIPDGVIRIYVFDVHNYKSRQMGTISDERNVISKGRDSVTNLLLEKEFLLKGQDFIIEKPDLNWCLISIDIIHFRFFDEWFGRDSGNLLLAKIGAIFAEKEVEINGISGYFGKDDFAIMMPYDEAKIKELYDAVRDVIFSFGSTAGFAPAFGVAMIEKGLSLVDAFDRATIAGAKAKADIANRICIYNPEMQFLAQKEYRLLSEYMQALKNGEIVFYLQPQCRISSKKIVGVESLARWIKKDGTIVSPAEFIPVLEKYGFIPDLDLYLWELNCQALSDWIKAGHVAVPVSLNVSRVDLFSLDVGKAITDLTDKYNIPHNLIKIEITESSYVEATDLIDKLVKELHDNGFQVLMDDFGSGYSSLNMLSNLKIDAIKLDGRFLHVEDSKQEKAIHILESVINMAKVMALPIIVEGVETKEQADFLESLGVRYIQGFYFYKPMSKAEFEKVVSDESKIDNRGFVVKLNEQVRIREFLDKNIYSDSMLNNIIGPVAFYSWQDGKTDIVRFNEQFYQAVHIQEFAERLENIERFIHIDDAEKMHNAFKKAMENKLTGASETLRFYTPDGTVLSFFIHFYYLGKKEGGERFYGAAQNVTELADLKEEKNLMANYSKDSIVFMRIVDNVWLYSVPCRGLADIFDISPADLEEELNIKEFARKRVVNRKKFDIIAKALVECAKEKKSFETNLDVFDSGRHPVTLHLSFSCVSGLSNNIAYILRTTYLG